MFIKKITVAEQQRSSKRGPKSWYDLRIFWYDLRILKKLKLVMKDELSKNKWDCSIILS